MPKHKLCSECGAELEPGPALCPLCGTPARAEKDWSDKPPTGGVDDYHSDLRKLKAQLKRLRDDDAEAV